MPIGCVLALGRTIRRQANGSTAETSGTASESGFVEPNPNTFPSMTAQMEPGKPLDLPQLTHVFRASQKPRTSWRAGLEAERFGVDADLRALPYAGPRGLEAIFGWLQAGTDWDPARETVDGPLLSLKSEQMSLTLEPGAQLELSGSPFASLHDVADEYGAHIEEIRAVEEHFGVRFIGVGFHPFAAQADLPWVPKRRYPIMRRYLPTRGARALDMMQRTATVQVNLDYESESDAMTKLVTLLRLTPLLQSLTLNSPFIEGRRSRLLSERLDVWLNMDPSRSGLIRELWDLPSPGYLDYVKWAVRAGMFLVLRDGKLHENTGQTFSDYMQRGHGDLTPMEQDWRLHLGTLFPEVRLKNTIEVRCCDSLPPDLALAVPALLVGMTYDSESLGRATELAQRVSSSGAVELQRDVARRGLQAELDGQTIQRSSLALLEIARSGLERRAISNQLGKDESIYLDPLQQLAEQGLTPAERLISKCETLGSLSSALLA